MKKRDIQAIDIVVNLWTREANALRPKRDAFYQGKMKVKKETAAGISHKEMLRRMDAAGTERAFLVATRAGRLGHPACYHLPYEMVAKAVKLHPDRFYGLAGQPDHPPGFTHTHPRHPGSNTRHRHRCDTHHPFHTIARFSGRRERTPNRSWPRDPAGSR